MALLNLIASPGNKHDPLNGIAWWLATLALLFAFGPEAQAQSAVAREYQIKAAFLFNFSQYVDWPAGTFTDTGAPLIIGVLGEDPFGAYLDDAVRGETSNGHPITVERYHNFAEAVRCHILFVNYTEPDRLNRAFATLKGRSILTVGEADHFSQSGGMIRFITVNNKIRLRVNLDAAKAAGLTLSSKLLRAAEVVTSTTK